MPGALEPFRAMQSRRMRDNRGVMIERRLTFRLDPPPEVPEAAAHLQRAAAWRTRQRAWRRRAGTLLLTFLAVSLVGAWWCFTRPAEYQTEAQLFITTRLQITDSGTDLINGVDVATRVRSVATLVNILRTRDTYDEAFAALPVALRRSGFGAERLANYPARVVTERDNDVVSIVVHARTPAAAEAFTRAILAAEERRSTTFNGAIISFATQQVNASLARCEDDLAQVTAAMTAVKAHSGVMDTRGASRTTEDMLAARQGAVLEAEGFEVRGVK